MAIKYPDRRVKTVTLTGMVQQDAMSWPWASTCLCWISDNYVPAHPRKLSFISDTLGNVITARRAGSPRIAGDCDDEGVAGDYKIRKMAGSGLCRITGGMRDGETSLDNFGFSASNDQTEIRFGTAVKGVGCYVQLSANANYYVRMRAYDSGGALLGSVIWEVFSYDSYASPPFERVAFPAIAYEASDAAVITRVDINVKNHSVGPGSPVALAKNPISDAVFDTGTEAQYHVGSLVIGHFDPLSGPTTHTVSLSDTFSLNEALRGGINELSRQDIIRFGWRLADDMIVNQVVARYDFNSTTGKFQTIKVYTFQASVDKYGLRNPAIIESKGVRTSSGGAAIMADRAQQIANRFSEPPVVLDVTTLYRRHNIEIGDVVEVTHDVIPNPVTGLRGLTQERFEIWRSRPKFLDEAFQEGVEFTLLDVESVTAAPAPSVTTPATFSMAASETVGLTENLGLVKTP